MLNVLNSISDSLNKTKDVVFTTGWNSGDLAAKMDELMPSIWIMIATLGSLLVLLIVLTTFLYNPVKKMVNRRKEFIKKNIDESIQAKRNAFDLENEANLKLQDSRNASDEIISKAKIEAEVIKNQYIEQAKREAERIIREANEDIQLKKKNLQNETYDEIVSVAIDISEKIIQNKISEKEAKKYLDNYLGNK